MWHNIYENKSRYERDRVAKMLNKIHWKCNVAFCKPCGLYNVIRLHETVYTIIQAHLNLSLKMNSCAWSIQLYI